MGGFTAISDVGNALVALLQEEMSLVNDDEVVLASPGDLGGKAPRLTLFLYRVTENSHLKNVEKPLEDDSRPRTPLVLDLGYVLTAHPQAPGPRSSTPKADQHSVLGEAMQVLHDHGKPCGSRLDGALTENDELHVSLAQDSTDELTNIWSTFNEQPYRVSVSYKVGPVEIPSTKRESFERVVEMEQETTLARRGDDDG